MIDEINSKHSFYNNAPSSYFFSCSSFRSTSINSRYVNTVNSHNGKPKSLSHSLPLCNAQTHTQTQAGIYQKNALCLLSILPLLSVTHFLRKQIFFCNSLVKVSACLFPSLPVLTAYASSPPPACTPLWLCKARGPPSCHLASRQ